MKTIETIVYGFDELSKDGKEKAMQWFRETGMEFEYEFHQDEFMEIARGLGIEISMRPVPTHGGKQVNKPAIFFSGFSSQGDGACFEGEWSASAVKSEHVKEYAPQDTDLHRIADEFSALAVKSPNARFSVKHSGRYYHEYSTVFDYDYGNETLTSEQVLELERETISTARAFMKWIYRQLEKEWKWQNSDECVAENIRANEYTFTIDGKRFGQ